MNMFSVISVGALSLLQTTRSGALLQLSLPLFLCLFSLIGLLISLRLKAELEECLGKLQTLSTFAEPQRALRPECMARSRRQGRTPLCPASPP